MFPSHELPRYSIANPTNMLPKSTASPYAFPSSTAGAAIDLPLPLLLLLPPPGVPVKMVSGPAEVELVVGGSVWDGPADVEVELYRLGSVAPQGLSVAQLDAHVLSIPQLVLHWITNCWQMKNGSVNEYSEMLGCWLFPQRQPYVKES
jgi:hypothetical protein